MKISLLSILILLVTFGCKNIPDSSKTTNSQIQKETVKPNKKTQKYVDSTWNFVLEYPSGYRILQGELTENTSIINVYSKNVEITEPPAVHEEPELAYIAFLPQGYNVDEVLGKQKAIIAWETNLDLSFHINKNDSRVYLLENGDAWAYYLSFSHAPEKWDKYGGIFVHYQIENFNASCTSAKGESKPVQECDSLTEDTLRISGEINKESKKQLDKIMSSLYFFRENPGERKELSDFIKVATPSPNELINSPLQISGSARGNWFFEADAPIKLVDKDYNILAETFIKAHGEWMTTDFVPFSGELIFEKLPEIKEGYLIFEKSNASGKPEFYRKLTIPVRFRSE